MSSDNILDFFNINWVSNIWTGLVTSAILGILKWFLEKRKYKQKINEANREIIITLESFISEKEYPNPSVLL
ncbi:hypothetical protein, partial [Priestia megaterium]|uniref:hypothetical protein n=1 Tax=Priestia megaterium TaxID=1404 RepID=UPI002FFEEB41